MIRIYIILCLMAKQKSDGMIIFSSGNKAKMVRLSKEVYLNLHEML